MWIFLIGSCPNWHQVSPTFLQILFTIRSNISQHILNQASNHIEGDSEILLQNQILRHQIPTSWSIRMLVQHIYLAIVT